MLAGGWDDAPPGAAPGFPATARGPSAPKASIRCRSPVWERRALFPLAQFGGDVAQILQSFRPEPCPVRLQLSTCNLGFRVFRPPSVTLHHEQTHPVPYPRTRRGPARAYVRPSPGRTRRRHREARSVHRHRLNLRAGESTGGVNLRVLSTAEVEQAGTGSLYSFLRKIPEVGAGSLGENRVNTSSPGTASVSLRGLGANSTLVLLNGRRVTPRPSPKAAPPPRSAPPSSSIST